MAERDDMASAIREAIGSMWRDTQERISNLRETLRDDIKQSEARLTSRVDAAQSATEARLAAVESRLADTMASVERLWQRQPIIVDFERFRLLEERLAQLESKIGH